MPDWDAAVPYLDVPTLLVAARDDATCSYSDTEELLESVPAVPCTLHTIEEGGHFGIFDTPMQPDDLYAVPAPHPAEVQRASQAIAHFLMTALKQEAV